MCVKHAWVQEQKFLLVPYHMLGAKDMESAILGGYVEHVRRLHPQAPWPGVYLADDIFANAQPIPAAPGRREVLAGLNQAPDDARWGAMEGLDYLTPWRLPSRLRPAMKRVRAWSASWCSTSSPPIRGVAAGKKKPMSLDKGLSIISQHAQDLGYDGLVLFLDELILWLASHAATWRSSTARGRNWRSWSSRRRPNARCHDQLRRPPA